MAKIKRSSAPPESVFRFLTPECEVQMSVQYFGQSDGDNFRFRDRLQDRAFCLSSKGNEDAGCLLRFSGSIAVALYHFRPRVRSQVPGNLRERVLTIDHDLRMEPQPVMERGMAVERDMVSDIQAFGYNRNSTDPPVPETVWCLLRQDLFLNDQPEPFLILHWKHTLQSIQLIDVIPAGETRAIGESA